MSKLNQIQNALKELDGAKFQKLADSYLKKKGYEHLNPLGSVLGADKVRVGTPDTLISLPNGKYVFAEHTTTVGNLYKKLDGDISKCLDESKTGIALSKIDEIVLCHTGYLEAKEIDLLSEKCQKAGVNLSIFDIGVISYDLHDKFRGLAKDFLGVEVDTGQIISPTEFIRLYGKNKLTTKLDTNFLFREEDLARLELALNSEELIIISGKAGVGKTRLALEAVRNFKVAHPEYETYCVLNNAGVNIFDDLKIYLSEPKSFLVIVDDANRISKFEYVVNMLKSKHDDQKLKVIATVRDYALESIMRSARELGVSEVIKLEVFTDQQIKTLVESEYQIRNYLYQDRIVALAKGNPRLAMMMADLAKRKDSLDSIANVSALYDAYYASIRDDLNDLNDQGLLKVAGIVSFFRAVDRKNEAQMQSIQQVFCVNCDEFWTRVKRLHDLEIVDVYEDEVVKISDQVLATYLFYLAVFKEEIFNFGVLLNSFFPQQRRRLIDAINPVFEAFDGVALTETIRPYVNTLWEANSEEKNKSVLFEIMEVFWFIDETKVLIHISDEIENLPFESCDKLALNYKKNSGSIDASILKILKLFKYSNQSNFRIALDLLCRYAEKVPTALAQILYIFQDSFGFTHKSYFYSYEIQKAVIDVIVEKSDKGKNVFFTKIFFSTVEKYLSTDFDCHESSDGNSISLIKFKLAETNEIREVRFKSLDTLISLFSREEYQSDVLEVLNNYSRSALNHSVSSIIEQDAIQLIPFISQQLSPVKFKHCYIAITYLNVLSDLKVKFDSDLVKKFHTNIFHIYKLLTTDYRERSVLKLDHNEYEEHKKARILKYVGKLNLESLKDLIDKCVEINASISITHSAFEFQQNFTYLLTLIEKNNTYLFVEICEYYLKLGNPIDIQPELLVKHLLDILGVDKTSEFLTRMEFNNKNSWILSFYQLIPSESINQDRLDQLLSIYKSTDLPSLPYRWTFLLNYQLFESKIISVVARIIHSRTEVDSKFAYAYNGLFYSDGIQEIIIDQFKDDIALLKTVYFQHLKCDRHGDYHGETFNQILNLDSNFIRNYIEWMFSSKKLLSEFDDERDYSFLWDRADYKDVMQKAVDVVFELEKDNKHFSYLKVFFGIRDRRQEIHISSKQLDFMMDQISARHHDVDFMYYIFSIVLYLPVEDRIKAFTSFVKFNKKYSVFEVLPIIPRARFWSDSAVPTLQAEIDYLGKLLPIFNDVLLLKHKHKVEEMITNARKEIEFEKKRDFMKDS